MITIGVFGTWRAKEGSEIYQMAESIGEISAEKDYSVLTGGYTGVMEAAPKGAKKVDGKTIGYTWEGLDGELEANTFLDKVIHFDNVAERVARLVNDSDICVFFPGRTGTVAELALATEVRAKGELYCPLVLMGKHWEGFFTWLSGTNDNLNLPADAEDKPSLFQILNNTNQFKEFITTHEHTWNK